jgi:hypothetical protein
MYENVVTSIDMSGECWGMEKAMELQLHNDVKRV